MKTKTTNTGKQAKATKEPATIKLAKQPKEEAPKKAKPAVPAKTGKLGALDAAAKVLGETGKPMNCKELIEAMATSGYWSTPNGKTPHATLYSAILKELRTKGAESRFKKIARGQFALRG